MRAARLAILPAIVAVALLSYALAQQQPSAANKPDAPAVAGSASRIIPSPVENDQWMPVGDFSAGN